MICEAIFRGRDLIFLEVAHTIIYFTEKIFFLNLDNLEAAPGRSAPELEVKTLKLVKFSYEFFFLAKKILKLYFILLSQMEANLNLPGGRWRLILVAS